MIGANRIQPRWLIVTALALGAAVHADVLPEDRSDLLFHRFDGGGVEVQGPSVLVRKKFGDSVSASYQYYEDLISSASIDVLSQASPYKEKRVQNNLGLDFLHNNTLYSAGFINSDEPDYKSKTAFLSVSQSMFGDLTTISFGFSRGWDRVGEDSRTNGLLTTTWLGRADHRTWTAGISQVLTRNLLLAMNFETGENEGYLQSPYRTVRYLDPSTGLVRSEAQATPNTRTGNAGSLQLKYYLPWHAALDGNYRLYHDTWGILAHTLGVGYTQPVFTDWTLNANVRYYRQNAANFYSDLFPYVDSQNFMSRDRELAQYQDYSIGLGATWQFHPRWPRWIEKGTLNVNYDRLRITYDDFHDYTIGQTPTGVPLYGYDASITQFFISIWY